MKGYLPKIFVFQEFYCTLTQYIQFFRGLAGYLASEWQAFLSYVSFGFSFNGSHVKRLNC